MRLALAAAIVLAEAPMIAVASSDLSDKVNQDRNLFQKESSRKRKPLVSLVPSAANFNSRSSMHEKSISTKTIPRSDGISKLTATECDPSIAHDYIADADVGILGCGPGQYCMESVESALGGLCIENVDHDIQRNLGIVDFQNGCNDSNITCASCTFDATFNVGQFSCVENLSCRQLDGLCQSSFELCSSTSFTGDYASSLYDVAICVYSEQPVKFTYCFSYRFISQVSNSCGVSINGVTCDTCTVSQDPVQPDYNCITFDCGNTFVQSSGDNCGNQVVDLGFEIVSKSITCPAASAPISNNAPSFTPVTAPSFTPVTGPNTNPTASIPTVQPTLAVIAGETPSSNAEPPDLTVASSLISLLGVTAALVLLT